MCVCVCVCVCVCYAYIYLYALSQDHTIYIPTPTPSSRCTHTHTHTHYIHTPQQAHTTITIPSHMEKAAPNWSNGNRPGRYRFQGLALHQMKAGVQDLTRVYACHPCPSLVSWGQCFHPLPIHCSSRESGHYPSINQLCSQWID